MKQGQGTNISSKWEEKWLHVILEIYYKSYRQLGEICYV